MPLQDLRLQQGIKIRRTTVVFGILQIIVGLVLTSSSFIAFSLTGSERIRNACPYWAGFTVLFSGGVSIIAWKHPGLLSLGLFSFFSAVSVVLQMIGTILTGDAGGFLKSLINCRSYTLTNSCSCCDSAAACSQGNFANHFDGTIDCELIQGELKELMYGMCIINIFGCLVCFIATVLGCTSVARHPSRNEILSTLHQSTRTESTCTTDGQYEWSPYPNDPQMLPTGAPPAYTCRSFETFQEFSTTNSFVVAPPVYDPTDFPPPYSSREVSVAGSDVSVGENNTIVQNNNNDNSTNSRVSRVVVETGIGDVQDNLSHQRLCEQCGISDVLAHQCSSAGNWSRHLPPYQQNEGNSINRENVSCSQDSATVEVNTPSNGCTQASLSSQTPTDESSAHEISSSDYSSSFDSNVSSLNTPPQDNFLDRESSSVAIEPHSVSRMNYSNTVNSNHLRALTDPENASSRMEQNSTFESAYGAQRLLRPPVRACLHHSGTSIIPPNVELPVDFYEGDFTPNTIQVQVQSSPNRNRPKRSKARAGNVVPKKAAKSKFVRNQHQRAKWSAVEESKMEAVRLMGNDSERIKGRSTSTNEIGVQECGTNTTILLNKETVV